MEFLDNPITYGVLVYLLTNFLGAVANLSRAILSIRYCAQYVIDASKRCGGVSRTEAMQTAWNDLVSDDAMKDSAMKVLSYPAGFISTALWIQREWLGLESENPATSNDIRDFAKYVVRAARLHDKDQRSPNAVMQNYCEKVAFYFKTPAELNRKPKSVSNMAAA